MTNLYKMEAYAKILMTYPSRVPDNINPDPEMLRLKGILYHMGLVDIKKQVLPLFLVKQTSDINPKSNPFAQPTLDKTKYLHIMSLMDVGGIRKAMWDTIVADKTRVQK